MAFLVTGAGPVRGYIAYYYLYNEVPNYSYWVGRIGTDPPPHVVANDVKQDPVFLSPNRTIARQFRWASVYAPTEIPVSPSLGLEYVLLTTPAGVVYAFGLGNDGNFYTEPFENGVPVNRQVVSTVMHKGSLIFIADNRQPMPKPGDW